MKCGKCGKEIAESELGRITTKTEVDGRTTLHTIEISWCKECTRTKGKSFVIEKINPIQLDDDDLCER